MEEGERRRGEEGGGEGRGEEEEGGKRRRRRRERREAEGRGRREGRSGRRGEGELLTGTPDGGHSLALSAVKPLAWGSGTFVRTPDGSPDHPSLGDPCVLRPSPNHPVPWQAVPASLSQRGPHFRSK